MEIASTIRFDWNRWFMEDCDEFVHYCVFDLLGWLSSYIEIDLVLNCSRALAKSADPNPLTAARPTH